MDSDDSDLETYYDLQEDYDVEDECFDCSEQSDSGESLPGGSDTTSEYEGHHSGEPLADEDWLRHYENTERENAKIEEMLLNRLTAVSAVSEWCKCGNCSTDVLVNISECYCCKELDGCDEALHSQEVLQDLDDNTELNCIIEHPGFSAVCLQKWSLRLAADKYKTRDRKRYQQSGSEESFLRSIAYREFTRLVYGYLGNKRRIPLPACAYTRIRQCFRTSDDELLSGFEMDLEPLV